MPKTTTSLYYWIPWVRISDREQHDLSLSVQGCLVVPQQGISDIWRELKTLKAKIIWEAFVLSWLVSGRTQNLGSVKTFDWNTYICHCHMDLGFLFHTGWDLGMGVREWQAKETQAELHDFLWPSLKSYRLSLSWSTTIRGSSQNPDSRMGT